VQSHGGDTSAVSNPLNLTNGGVHKSIGYSLLGKTFLQTNSAGWLSGQSESVTVSARLQSRSRR